MTSVKDKDIHHVQSSGDFWILKLHNLCGRELKAFDFQKFVCHVYYDIVDNGHFVNLLLNMGMPPDALHHITLSYRRGFTTCST